MEFTEEEQAIIRTALSILPHLGPDATAAYLHSAAEDDHGKHEKGER